MLKTLLVLTILLAAPFARGAAPDASEPGRIAAEAVAALMTSGVELAIVGVSADAGPVALVALSATPAGTGAVVCAIGSGSDIYQGSCAAAMAGAYVGALGLLPGLAIGFQLGDHGEPFDELAGALVGAVVGYVIGSSIGAVVGWNASRTPRRTLRPEGLTLQF